MIIFQQIRESKNFLKLDLEKIPAPKVHEFAIEEQDDIDK